MENDRMLIVDDDPGVRDAYKSILCPSPSGNIVAKGAALFDGPSADTEPVAQKRYDLIMVNRGEEGVKAVEKAVAQKMPFAAAFVDMKMPGMDGAETARQIWAIDPNIKIIIVTAYSEHTPDDIIKVTGRDDIFYLRKPFNPEEIRQFARVFGYQWSLERERELLHDEIEKVNADLETLVEQRTAELRRAYDKLRLLDEDKITFLRYLSHEMNTPLNWIGATQAMDQNALSEENKEMVGMVENGFERLNNLINAVLSYFELAGSDLKLKSENVSLQELMSDIIAPRKGIIAAAGLTITNRFQEVQNVQADPEFFKEILMILLDNAIAFSERGGTLTIGTDVDGEKIRVTIADNGRGIDMEDLQKIFKPFAIEEFKRREGGYGLNLPKARIIADALGWKIRAESEGKGCGARFIIEI